MKITINNYKILLFLILFINIPPVFFLRESDVSRLFFFFQSITFIILSMFFMLSLKKLSNLNFIFLICLFWGIFGYSTLINGNGKFTEVIRPLIISLSVCTSFVLSLKNINNFIEVAAFYFKVLIYINLITIIFYPNGLYLVYGNVNAHYFLGHRNNTIEYIIPALLFNLIRDINKYNKYSFNIYSLTFISIISVFLTWSVNAVLVLTFLIFVIFTPCINRVKNFFNIYNFSIGYVMLFILIVILKFQNYFEWLIVGILHRSLDFTNRVHIWDRSLFWIKESFIFGYGYENAGIKILKIFHSNSCHNYLLDFLYMGGILMVFVFCIILFKTSNKLKQIKEISKRKNLEMFILSYFILGFATPIHKDVLCIMFLVICVCYYGVNIYNEKGDCEND